MTTYEIINGNLICPICKAHLYSHEKSDTVLCSNSNCKFNNILTWGDIDTTMKYCIVKMNKNN